MGIFERQILDKEGPLYVNYIHPRIWEMGDYHFPVWKADLVARTAWVLLQYQMATLADVPEFLEDLFDGLVISEERTMIIGDKIDVVKRVLSAGE